MNFILLLVGTHCMFRLLNDLDLIQFYQENPSVDITADTLKAEIRKALQQVNEVRIVYEFTELNCAQQQQDDNTEKKGFALVLEGHILKVALDKGAEGVEPLFMELALQCATCICCRVTPAQKATVSLYSDC